MDVASSDGEALTDLAASVADLREADVLRTVRERIERGDDPVAVIEECQAGMRLVGERYSQRRYFLSGLIMAGDILRQVMEMVQPSLEERFSGDASARVLLGTVQGDIHDLGKNLFAMLARCHGLTVYDLGVDVAPARFLDEFDRLRPDVVGLSGLLTASYDPMRETIALLRARSAGVPVIIGGQIDEQVSRYVGADYFVTDAMEGVRLCQRLAGS
jgi:methanogenic corrinoid protein MtbC1